MPDSGWPPGAGSTIINHPRAGFVPATPLPFRKPGCHADLVTTRHPDLSPAGQGHARTQWPARRRWRPVGRAADPSLSPRLLSVVLARPADSLVVTGPTHRDLP